ncbi:hypothetical protein I4F81_011482 [Pyropia yezoensis]|uniref:Uncharacterized protein n=1 Tax=Pyropia yezoensis TaxID=2788 RepID=A0ACC3CGD6_PYRYE|nr:hypothetical protein I4F81_011482 [Neopyropia yezoensis]
MARSQSTPGRARSRLSPLTAAAAATTPSARASAVAAAATAAVVVAAAGRELLPVLKARPLLPVPIVRPLLLAARPSSGVAGRRQWRPQAPTRTPRRGGGRRAAPLASRPTTQPRHTHTRQTPRPQRGQSPRRHRRRRQA